MLYEPSQVKRKAGGGRPKGSIDKRQRALRTDKVASSSCRLHGAVPIDNSAHPPRKIPTNLHAMDHSVADDAVVSFAEATVNTSATVTTATSDNSAIMMDIEDVDDVVDDSNGANIVIAIASVAAVEEDTETTAAMSTTVTVENVENPENVSAEDMISLPIYDGVPMESVHTDRMDNAPTNSVPMDKKDSVDSVPTDSAICDATSSTQVLMRDHVTLVRATRSRNSRTTNNSSGFIDWVLPDGPPSKRLRSRFTAHKLLCSDNNPPARGGGRVRNTRWLRVRTVVGASNAATKVAVAFPLISKQLSGTQRARVASRPQFRNTNKGFDGQSRVLRPRYPVASSFSDPSLSFAKGSSSATTSRTTRSMHGRGE